MENPDGFCQNWHPMRALFAGRYKEYEQHLMQCEKCKAADKKWREAWGELSKCANGTCGHGHTGDPPGSVGGSDF